MARILRKPDQEDPWTWGYDDNWDHNQPTTINADIDDPKIIGHILGPDGTPIHTVRPANWRPFGFQPRN